jgi:hypothetical protein
MIRAAFCERGGTVVIEAPPLANASRRIGTPPSQTAAPCNTPRSLSAATDLRRDLEWGVSCCMNAERQRRSVAEVEDHLIATAGVFFVQQLLKRVQIVELRI